MNIRSSDEIRIRLEQLQKEIHELQIKRDQQQMDMENMENPTLKQRFQDILDSVLQQMLEKEQMVVYYLIELSLYKIKVTFFLFIKFLFFIFSTKNYQSFYNRID